MTISCAHPKESDKTASIIYVNALESERQLRRLFHYLKYSLLVISQNKMGRPELSLEIFPTKPENNPLEYRF